FAFGNLVCDICIPKGTPRSEADRIARQVATLLSLGAGLAYGGGDRVVSYAMAPILGQVFSPATQNYAWKLDMGEFRDSVKSIRVTSNQPVVQYRHYYATHQPVLYDDDCSVRAEEEIPKALEAVESEVTCALISVGL